MMLSGTVGHQSCWHQSAKQWLETLLPSSTATFPASSLYVIVVNCQLPTWCEIPPLLPVSSQLTVNWLMSSDLF